MRKKFIAGNWKMNLDRQGCKALAESVKDWVAQNGSNGQVDVAVCPSFVYLATVAEALRDSSIQVGAQDVYCKGNGAYTGEISAAMLRDVGCDFVIVGHSERRHEIGETDELVNQKLLTALGSGLDVIFCIGELLEEREQGKTETVLSRQVHLGLAGVSKEQMDRVTVAYEPVWAIGTGKTATTEQAQSAQSYVRSELAQLFDEATAETIRIQYGGSVKPDNAAELMAQPDVDGALVGGASLKLEDFTAIIQAGTITNG